MNGNDRDIQGKLILGYFKGGPSLQATELRAEFLTATKATAGPSGPQNLLADNWRRQLNLTGILSKQRSPKSLIAANLSDMNRNILQDK